MEQFHRLYRFEALGFFCSQFCRVGSGTFGVGSLREGREEVFVFSIIWKNKPNPQAYFSFSKKTPTHQLVPLQNKATHKPPHVPLQTRCETGLVCGVSPWAFHLWRELKYVFNAMFEYSREAS